MSCPTPRLYIHQETSSAFIKLMHLVTEMLQLKEDISYLQFHHWKRS